MLCQCDPLCRESSHVTASFALSYEEQRWSSAISHTTLRHHCKRGGTLFSFLTSLPVALPRNTSIVSAMLHFRAATWNSSMRWGWGVAVTGCAAPQHRQHAKARCCSPSVALRRTARTWSANSVALFGHRKTFYLQHVLKKIFDKKGIQYFILKE